MVSATYIFSNAPPSLNGAYANARKGRVKTSAYRAWLDAAGWEIKMQGAQFVPAPYGLEIEVGRNASKADIDNLIKPISDLLNNIKITPDDRAMDAVSIRRTDRADVLVKVYQL